MGREMGFPRVRSSEHGSVTTSFATSSLKFNTQLVPKIRVYIEQRKRESLVIVKIEHTPLK